MARFYGKVGFGQTVEVRPGVWEDVITERNLYGDVLRPSRSADLGDKAIPDSRMGNRISVMADAHVLSMIHDIRYVEYRGELWYISRIDEEPPRLIFSLGEVYNGPRP
jgi:hypothetical protein